MGNWCVWLGRERGRKNGGPRSFLSGPTKLNHSNSKWKHGWKCLKILWAKSPRPMFKAFLSFSSLFLWSFGFFLQLCSCLILSSTFFFFAYPFFGFFTFSFLSYFDIFFSFSFITCRVFLFSNSQLVFFLIKKFLVLELLVFYLFNV